MPKDFGPPERAPVLPRKKTPSDVILLIGFVEQLVIISALVFCSQVV